MSVPDRIDITWDGPDAAGAFRSYALSGGKVIGSAVALPDPQAPGAWVVSHLKLDNPDHYDTLGDTLLRRLVEQIEHDSPLGGSTVITVSHASAETRRVVKAYGPRITYRPGG